MNIFICLNGANRKTIATCNGNPEPQSQWSSGSNCNTPAALEKHNNWEIGALFSVVCRLVVRHERSPSTCRRRTPTHTLSNTSLSVFAYFSNKHSTTTTIKTEGLPILYHSSGIFTRSQRFAHGTRITILISFDLRIYDFLNPILIHNR